jgi:hypothetical protein
MSPNDLLADAAAIDATLPAAPATATTESRLRVAADPYALSRWEQGWQQRLLPFLQILIGLVAVFFLTATLFQLDRIQEKISDAPTFAPDPAPEISAPDAAALSAADRLLFVQWKTLATLERSALERRYHQANVLLMSRTWTRYLGFVTGMIMALIGSGFILGKFRESTTTLRIDSAPVKGALASASPGLVLATLGTALMMATILIHNDIDTRMGRSTWRALSPLAAIGPSRSARQCRLLLTAYSAQWPTPRTVPIAHRNHAHHDETCQTCLRTVERHRAHAV